MFKSMIFVKGPHKQFFIRLLSGLCLAVACVLRVPVCLTAELQGWFSTSNKWIEIPSGVPSSGMEGNVAMLTPQSTWRQVTDSQVRLLNGNMLVRPRTKAIFVSQQFGSDQLMIRVAPGATALISGPEKYTVSNVCKRCCGAVIVYLPHGEKGSTNKVTVLAGETVCLEIIENEKPIEHASSSEFVRTTCGIVRMTRQKDDLDHTVERLNLKEVLNR